MKFEELAGRRTDGNGPGHKAIVIANIRLAILNRLLDVARQVDARVYLPEAKYLSYNPAGQGIAHGPCKRIYNAEFWQLGSISFLSQGE